MSKTGRIIRKIPLVFSGIAFLALAAVIVKILSEYRASAALYENLAKEFVTEEDIALPEKTEDEQERSAPVRVDFEALQKINKEITGWIYCEKTDINYPVLQGADNDFYLNHTYDKKQARAGSVFVEALNAPAFADANTIIYGHHMKDGSMFASLENWSSQAYYEEHPALWLLTPKQDYRIVLFSGYTTTADSDTYTIFEGASEAFDDYLKAVSENSDFHTDAVWDGEKKFVVLSTCSYAFEDARYVLHGMLMPCEKKRE